MRDDVIGATQCHSPVCQLIFTHILNTEHSGSLHCGTENMSCHITDISLSRCNLIRRLFVPGSPSLLRPKKYQGLQPCALLHADYAALTEELDHWILCYKRLPLFF